MPYEMELKCWNISSFNKRNVKFCQCRELERHYERNRASLTDSGTFYLLLLVPSSLLPASCLKFIQCHSSPSSYCGTCTDSFSSSFSSILIDSFLSLIGIPEVSYPALAHLHFGGVEWFLLVQWAQISPNLGNWIAKFSAIQWSTAIPFPMWP